MEGQLGVAGSSAGRKQPQVRGPRDGGRRAQGVAQCAGQTRFRGRHAFSALQAAVENRRRRRRRPGGRSDGDFLRRLCRRSGEAPGSGDRRTRRAPSARQPRPAAGPVRSVHAAAVPGAVRRARPVAGTGTPGRSRPPPTAHRRAESSGTAGGGRGLRRRDARPGPVAPGPLSAPLRQNQAGQVGAGSAPPAGLRHRGKAEGPGDPGVPARAGDNLRS